MRVGHDAVVAWYRRYNAVCVDEPWLAVHLTDRGTHLGPWRGAAPTGRAVTTDEFAMYRLEGGRIAEVWVTADNARLPRR